jgi:hypothetical protein
VKINNQAPFYARLVIEIAPGLKDFLETRVQSHERNLAQGHMGAEGTGAVDELFDDGRCTPELHDVLKERVWRELEEANECRSKTISVPARNLASVK